MPLIDKALEGELIGVYEKGAKGNRDPKTVGRKTAKAYFNYVKQGKDVGGGTFAAMPGNSQLIQKLGDIYSKKKGNAELQSMAMARAFNECLGTFTTSYQVSIATAGGMSVLTTALKTLLSKPNNSSTKYAQDLAKALHAFTSAAIISLIVPDSPGIPMTGPIV